MAVGSYESHGTHFLIRAPRENEAHLPESVSIFQHKTLVAVMSKRDLKSGRPALGKTAYKARIRLVLRRKGTQKVAARFSSQLYSACREVIKKKGAATRG